MKAVNARTKEILDAALALPAEERALLVDELAASVEGEDLGIDASELEARVEDVVSGRVETLDAEEVFDELMIRFGHR